MLTHVCLDGSNGLVGLSLEFNTIGYPAPQLLIARSQNRETDSPRIVALLRVPGIVDMSHMNPHMNIVPSHEVSVDIRAHIVHTALLFAG